METASKMEQTLTLNRETVGRVARLGRDGQCISLDKQFSVFNGMEIGDLVQVTINIVKKNVVRKDKNNGTPSENKNVVMELASYNPLESYWKHNFSDSY